jgi:hypothetical protein
MFFRPDSIPKTPHIICAALWNSVPDGTYSPDKPPPPTTRCITNAHIFDDGNLPQSILAKLIDGQVMYPYDGGAGTFKNVISGTQFLCHLRKDENGDPIYYQVVHPGQDNGIAVAYDSAQTTEDDPPVPCVTVGIERNDNDGAHVIFAASWQGIRLADVSPDDPLQGHFGLSSKGDEGDHTRGKSFQQLCTELRCFYDNPRDGAGEILIVGSCSI